MACNEIGILVSSTVEVIINNAELWDWRFVLSRVACSTNHRSNQSELLFSNSAISTLTCASLFKLRDVLQLNLRLLRHIRCRAQHVQEVDCLVRIVCLLDGEDVWEKSVWSSRSRSAFKSYYRVVWTSIDTTCNYYLMWKVYHNDWVLDWSGRRVTLYPSLDGFEFELELNMDNVS